MFLHLVPLSVRCQTKYLTFLSFMKEKNRIFAPNFFHISGKISSKSNFDNFRNLNNNL